MLFKKLLIASLLISTISATTSAMTCTTLTKNLSKGSEISEVITLQQFLFDSGYLKTKPNGYFGPGTVSAVKKFQLANGMSPIGSVGKMTRAKVKEVSCLKSVVAISTNLASSTALIYESKELVERLYGTNMTPYFSEKYPMVDEKLLTKGVLFGEGLSPDQIIKSVDVVSSTQGGAKASATFVDETKTDPEYIRNPEKVVGKSIYTITVEWKPNMIDFEKTDTLTIVILFKDNKIQKIPVHVFPAKYVNFIKEDLKNRTLSDGSLTVTDPQGIYLLKIRAKDPKKPLAGIFQLDEIVNRFGAVTSRYLRESGTSSNILSIERLDAPGESEKYRYARLADEDNYMKKLTAKDKEEKERIIAKSSQKNLVVKDSQAESKKIINSATDTTSTAAIALINQRNLQRERDVKVIASAIEEYYVSNGLKFPVSVTSIPKETCISSKYSCEGMIEPWLAPKYLPVMLVEPGTISKNGSGYLVSVSNKYLIISAQYTEGNGGVIRKVMEISE